MTMYIVIEHTPEGSISASFLGIPGMIVHAASEQEAIALLRRSFHARIQHARIIPIDLAVAPTENPWLFLGQQSQENPLLGEVADAISIYRQQLDTVAEVA